MAENPYVNKVIYGDQTLIDLTDDTVSPSSLKLGSTAHDASGAQITGTADDAPKRTLAYIFDSSDSYAVSDYVYYEDKLYRCIVAHSGTWNSEHFVETTIGDELNDKMAEMTILSYGKSTWNDFLTAYTGNKVVYCRASSNANPATGSQTRLAFMAYVNNETNPTNVEFQYYRSVNAHTASQQGDQVFVYKLDKTAGWTVTTREASVKIVAGTNMSSSYSNDTLTLNATDTTYESKAAASGGTDLSLVTTGEKYNWNARGVPASGTTGQVLKKSSNSDYAVEWADESGGGSLHVTVTNSGGTYVFDKTNAEIYNAYLNGSYVFLTEGYQIYELQSVSQTEAVFKRIDVGDASASKRVFISNNGNVSFTRTTFEKTVPAKLQLVNDGSTEYQDSPTGPFSVDQSDIGDISAVPAMVSGELGYGSILLSFGSPYAEGSATAVAEYYNLVSVAYEPTNPDAVTLTFRTTSMRSGSPIIKTVTISDYVDTYDYMQNATVTYSEEEAGGGSAPLIVTFTRGSTTTADKTFAEVYAAYQSGAVIYGNLSPTSPGLLRLRSVSSNIIDFSRTDVDSGGKRVEETFVTLYSNNTALYHQTFARIPDVPIEIPIYVDMSYEYQDPPTGNLSTDVPMNMYQFREGVDAYLLYGDSVSQGNIPGRDERYRLSYVDVESRYYEDWGDEAPYIFAHFQTIGVRNGTVLLKKFTIEGYEDYPLSQATVTYSEISLSTPPSASGVSF